MTRNNAASIAVVLAVAALTRNRVPMHMVNFSINRADRLEFFFMTQRNLIWGGGLEGPDFDNGGKQQKLLQQASEAPKHKANINGVHPVHKGIWVWIWPGEILTMVRIYHGENKADAVKVTHFGGHSFFLEPN